MMMISALSAPPPGAAMATSAPDDTVTTALTSRPPSGRYLVLVDVDGEAGVGHRRILLDNGSQAA